MNTRKIRKIIIITLLSISAWLTLHNIMLAVETKKLNGPGIYVPVGDSQLHLIDTGKAANESHAIILLSGFGTGSPAIDFRPLAEELSDEYRVITIEPLGYGFSGMTQDTRIIENIVDEIRQALKAIDAKPPYILLPHSISGVYSYYYAANFPDEVAAIIGDDCAVPAFVDVEEDSNPITERLIYYSGATRLAHLLFPVTLTPKEMSASYSKDELQKLRKQTIRTFANRVVIDEWKHYYENGRKAQSLKINPNLPVLFFMADKPEFDSNPYTKERMKVVDAQNRGRAVVLDSGHYMHRTHAKEMAEEIKDFLRISIP